MSGLSLRVGRGVVTVRRVWRCARELCWRRLGLSITTVRRWRNRFVVDRCDGLLDEPRPGRPRVVGDEQITELITATLESTPPDATHWSTRSMAAHLGLSQSMVSRVWRAVGLVPHKKGFGEKAEY